MDSRGKGKNERGKRNKSDEGKISIGGGGRDPLSEGGIRGENKPVSGMRKKVGRYYSIHWGGRVIALLRTLNLLRTVTRVVTWKR